MSLLPGLRARLEERFKCPVLDLYSMNEAGPLAVADASAGGHCRAGASGDAADDVLERSDRLAADYAGHHDPLCRRNFSASPASAPSRSEMSG